MVTIAPVPTGDDDGELGADRTQPSYTGRPAGRVTAFDDAAADEFQPLSADEARHWRERQPPAVSPWRVLGIQVLAALLLLVLVALVSRFDRRLALSVAYGAAAAVVPAVLFARAMARQMRLQMPPGAALVALMVWEGVKVILTVLLLLLAPSIVMPLSWLALLAGFVVTIKASWVALWWYSVRRKAD